MAGKWTSFNVPNTSTGTFFADIMILLTDGSALIHNGYVAALGNANQWLRLTPDDHGNYDTGTWSSQIEMKYARQWFGSGVLSDGRVFVIGGEHSNDPASPDDSWTGELFDPQANSGVGAWTMISKPSPGFDFVRGDCNGSVLADGRVLIGGASTPGPPSSWSKRTAIWDPKNDTWVEAGLKFGALSSTDKKDPFEEETFSLLPDGSVLAPAVRDTPKAQRYVPSLDEWVDCTPSPAKLAIKTLKGVGVFETGPVILLASGKSFAIGGTGKTAIFTPGLHPADPGSWTPGPHFPNDTSATPNWPTLTALDAPACLLPSGKVVLLAGTTTPDAGDYFSLNPVVLEYDPQSAPSILPSRPSRHFPSATIRGSRPSCFCQQDSSFAAHRVTPFSFTHRILPADCPTIPGDRGTSQFLMDWSPATASVFSALKSTVCPRHCAMEMTRAWPLTTQSSASPNRAQAESSICEAITFQPWESLLDPKCLTTSIRARLISHPICLTGNGNW
jgi:hypothetical protein